MEFQKCSDFRPFEFYFTLYKNQSFFSFKEFSMVFWSLSTFLHFENVPSIDVVSPRTPQTIRNYKCVII